jgi:hypothetical protein
LGQFANSALNKPNEPIREEACCCPRCRKFDVDLLDRVVEAEERLKEVNSQYTPKSIIEAREEFRALNGAHITMPVSRSVLVVRCSFAGISIFQKAHFRVK